MEKTLAAIWSDELGIKLVGLEDDFYELGGHSLSAARIVSKINHTLNKDITLNDFYHAHTIAKLATVLNKVTNKNEIIPIPAKTLNDDSALLPLADFQFLFWISSTFEPKAKKLNVIARKRLQGKPDLNALNFAFKAVFKKHEALFYRILKLRPAQKLQKDLTFKIIEKNIVSLSEQDSELILDASFNELLYYFPWHKKAPLLIARLFYMNNEVTELQLCMPHIISDDISLNVLLSDLSKFYLLYNQHFDLKSIDADRHYREYVFNEQYYFQKYIARDINFWEHYLNDARLFAFPPEKIVTNMASQGFSYSTYVEMPEQGLNNLQLFCAKNHVSTNDGLCAALALALFNCCKKYKNNETHPIFINIIKSTRDQQSYDDTIGCFIRLEPIKVNINKKSNLSTLSKRIHQSVIDTNLYQRCSSLVKLSCLHQFRQKKQNIKNFLSSLFIYAYTTLFRTPKLNRKILNQCAQLSPLGKNNNYIINFNVQNNFISGDKQKNELNLFGLETKNIKISSYDLMKIDYVFDVCFIRNDKNNTPYLIISANLIPAFRELIAKEIIQIINSETVDLTYIKDKDPLYI